MSDSDYSLSDKLENITDGIDEIGNIDILECTLLTRDLDIYWGTTPTNIPHLLYFFPILRIINFLKHNCSVKILLADIHAFLDSKKSDIEILNHRTDIHEHIIKYIINYFNIDTNKLTFIQGSSYQLTPEFTMNMYKLNSIAKVSEVKKIGKRVVKQAEDPLMTSLLYPSLQILDMEHLDADVFYGDMNQKDICMYANKIMAKMGYRTRGWFLDDIYPSINDFKDITMLDSYDMIYNKVTSINTIKVFDLIQFLLLEICKMKGEKYVINYNEYSDAYSIKHDYMAGIINTEDLKLSVIKYLDDIINPLRDEYTEPVLKEKLKLAKYI